MVIDTKCTLTVLSNKPANSRMFENVLESLRHLAVSLDVGVLQRFDNVRECSRIFKDVYNFQECSRMFDKFKTFGS